MSLKQRLRTCLCCIALEMGALTGVPMRPEQIQDLMHALNRPKVAQTDPEKDTQADRDRANPPRRIE